jgi:hypothetical protein
MGSGCLLRSHGLVCVIESTGLMNSSDCYWIWIEESRVSEGC